MDADVRWKQRFDNFDRAVHLLREVCDRGVATLSQLEKEGAIQRFEIAFELGWKVLRDFLEASGLVVSPITPRTVIKEAAGARLLDDAQVWIEMMLSRNLLSHTYDIKVFEEVLADVELRYFAALERLHQHLLAKTLAP